MVKLRIILLSSEEWWQVKSHTSKYISDETKRNVKGSSRKKLEQIRTCMSDTSDERALNTETS